MAPMTEIERWKWRLITWLVEYAVMGINIVFNYNLLLGTYGVGIWWVHAILQINNCILQYSRELFFFWLFGDRIAKAKRDYTLTWRDWSFVLQANVISCVGVVFGAARGSIYFTPLTFSFQTWVEVFVTGWILCFLKDMLSMQIFHRLMHTKWFYFLHKTHHAVKNNCQNMLSIHGDTVDLFLENLSAPFAFCFILRVLGKKPQYHYVAMAYSSYIDMQSHSVNPFSTIFFNPALDFMFNCNVCHHLHHAVQNEYYTFIPYHHIIPGARKADQDRYDSVMKTSFFKDEETKKVA